MTGPILTPPPPQHSPADHTVRFAVGRPEGLRSSSWSVIGGTADRDVYIGCRTNLRDIKLSLHRSGKWRMAFEKPYASAHDVPADRVVARWDPPQPVAAGWRIATSIIVPMSSLRPTFPEKRPSGGSTISWWPATKPGRAIFFNVFVAESPYDEGITVDSIGQVGSIDLPDGGKVWILADEADFAAHEAIVNQLRAYTFSLGEPADPNTESMAWGKDDETGRPVLYDLGDLSAFHTPHPACETLVQLADPPGPSDDDSLGPQMIESVTRRS